MSGRRLRALAALGIMGCSPDAATALRDGLAAKDCSRVPGDDLQESCWIQVGRCAEVQSERGLADCAFRAAEAKGDPEGCSRAGPWVDDCRLHVWSASFHDWAPKGKTLAEAEPIVTAKLDGYGFAADDPRPWSAWYRWSLGRMRPVDRAACREISAPDHQEACLQTGLALYGDLLNVARDRHLYPCDGGPLPSLLQSTPDPELEALRASRTDLCPG